jgi:hypothetical protein
MSLRLLWLASGFCHTVAGAADATRAAVTEHTCIVCHCSRDSSSTSSALRRRRAH